MYKLILRFLNKRCFTRREKKVWPVAVDAILFSIRLETALSTVGPL